MKKISSVQSFQKQCLNLKKQGEKLAIVPTMGALHEGHLSLIRIAKKNSTKVILTIFVNPLQFGPKEDLDKYPRTLTKDLKLAKREGVDLIFCPQIEDLYDENFQTYVDVEKITHKLCGKSRPGHFRGVTTIVMKLFMLSQADVGVFGKKDYQQYRVISQMVKDLNLPIKIIGAPIKREKSGLALSSRNQYLSSSESQAALVLSQALKLLKNLIQEGEKNISQLKRRIRTHISKEDLVNIDYIEILDSESLEPIEKYRSKKTLMALAVFVGKTRLIDNVVV